MVILFRPLAGLQIRLEFFLERFASALIPRPFVIVAIGRFVKGRSATKSQGAVPIHFGVADVAVHKTHHVARVWKLQWLPAVMAAQTEAAGNLANDFGPG